MVPFDALHLKLQKKKLINRLIPCMLQIISNRKKAIRMYLDYLPTAVLHLCEEYQLSVESAAKRCCISSGCLRNIIQGKTAPTILTLEKLCFGLECTPNDLLMPSQVIQMDSFRVAMPVTQIYCYRVYHGFLDFPLCPRCGNPMEREYQAFCDRCGQCLSWKAYSKATIILSKK